MKGSKEKDNVTTVQVGFRHNASKVIYDLLKKHRLVITTRRYNRRYLVTLRDSYVVRKFTPNTIFAYCDYTAREVEIDVDDIKEIEIWN